MGSIGRYIPGNSYIHKLDPRLKLVINILIIVLVFLTESFLILAILFAPIFIAYVNAKLKLYGIYKTLKTVLYIGVFLLLINMVVTSSNTSSINVLGSWWIFDYSHESLFTTLIIMSRIFIMILTTTVLTATTKPTSLTRGIEDILSPLKLLFIPVNVIAMIISIALRFIPTLLNESQRIMKAQASRGVDFKNGGLRSKSKSMLTLIIPLFVSAFAKAEDLGNAMETRGYDPYEKRTRYRQYPITFLDVFEFLIIIGIAVFVILQTNGTIIVPSWWV